MGHDTQDNRDKKVYAMMDKALTQMAKTDVIDSRKLASAIDKNTPAKRTTKLASASSYLPKKAKGGNWAIQIGSFSNYNKAQSHAQKIKNKLAGKFAVRNTDIEKFTQNGKTLYRAKLVGLAQNDAQKACSVLKNNNQACMVTSYKPNSAYAQK